MPMKRWSDRVRRVWRVLCQTCRATGSADGGMTLIELLATVLIASFVSAALVALFSAVLGAYGSIGGGAVGLSDSTSASWMIEKLAQNAVAIGTMKPSSNPTFAPGPIAGPVPVLALQVTNLQGITPSSAPVYSAAARGRFICLAVVPYGGRFVLGLFAGGLPYDPTARPPVYPPSSAVTPLFAEGSDFSGTTFQVPSASTFFVDMAMRSAGPGSQGAQRTYSVRYPFMIGRQDY